jgi:hypothetical protein
LHGKVRGARGGRDIGWRSSVLVQATVCSTLQFDARKVGHLFEAGAAMGGVGQGEDCLQVCVRVEVRRQRDALSCALTRKLVAQIPLAVSDQNGAALLEGLDEASLLQPGLKLLENLVQWRRHVHLALCDVRERCAKLAELPWFASWCSGRSHISMEVVNLLPRLGAIVLVACGDTHDGLRVMHGVAVRSGATEHSRAH